MRLTAKWAVVLVMLLLLGSLQQSLVWGQLRTRSGAFSYRENALQHPKELERRIFALTNDARRRNGLPPLAQDSGLASTAQKFSDDMLQRNFFSHTAPDGKTLKDRLQEEEPAKFKTMSRAGENIASLSRLDIRDITTTSRMIMDGWMSSPGHRANILNADYTHLGVGVAIMGKEVRATQEFAQRKSAVNTP